MTNVGIFCEDSDLILKRMERRCTLPIIDSFNNDLPCHRPHKEYGRRALRTLLNRLRLRRAASAEISTPDPVYKVAYLGNVLTGWAKGEGCVEKPLATLWRNYTQSSRPDVRMQLTVSGGGLKANTKDHGLTEYWANRITYCGAPKHFPRIFCWVYRHEGRKMRHELRCHAVLCTSSSIAKQIEIQLCASLAQALAEFKKDKISKQNARLSLANCVYENPSMPRRKILLSTGSSNYRPPLERSKSAPKLTMIEENLGEEDEEFSEEFRRIAAYAIKGHDRILRHCGSTSALIDKKIALRQRLAETSELRISTGISDKEETVKEEDTSRTINCDTDTNNSENETQSSLLEELILECESKDDNLSWFRRTDITTDVPVDSDESSLSSGCESASTFNSNEDQTIVEENNKNELDFKLGGTVLSSINRLTNCTDVRKFCGIKHHNLRVYQEIPDADEVSLVPVGESHNDFSSLKVFKKRTANECEKETNGLMFVDGSNNSNSLERDEADSACSDESGYEELIESNNDESPSPISKIVLV